MRRVGGPIWNGEFGPVYQNAEDGLPDWQEINKRRYHVLEDQLELYDKAKASWSIWLWKDIGFQGMVYVGEETPYIKMLKPFLEKKKVRTRSLWLRTPSDAFSLATCFGRVGMRRQARSTHLRPFDQVDGGVCPVNQDAIPQDLGNLSACGTTGSKHLAFCESTVAGAFHFC